MNLRLIFIFGPVSKIPLGKEPARADDTPRALGFQPSFYEDRMLLAVASGPQDCSLKGRLYSAECDCSNITIKTVPRL
jgi:hypothetical protein